MSMGQTALTIWGITDIPITPSFYFLGMIAVMGFQMSDNMLRAAMLSDDLRESEARYRGLFEGAMEGMYRTSLKEKYTVANPAFAKMLGYDSLQDAALAFEDTARDIWVNPNERSQFVERLDKSGIIRGYECQFKQKDGAKIWVSISSQIVQGPDGQILYVEGFVEDITDRKRMETAIRQAADEWQATFDSIPNLVMILDPDCRIVRVNAAAKSFLGLPAERILGSRCHTLMHGIEEPVEGCPFVRTMRSKKHEETEFYFEARNVWLRISTDPILNEKGEIRHIVHSAKDITNEKKIEAETFVARKELLRTERLLSMGELTASLAHELNQPLTSILSNAQAGLRFIQSDRLDVDELKEILEDIATDDKRAGKIIRSLRSMLKPDEIELEMISINDVLSEMIVLFHSEAVIRRITVETNFTDPLPLLSVNKVQIQQVIVNLLMNAADAMVDQSENRRIVIRSAKTDDGDVRVAIRDFGLGIDETERTRIFEPFFTTKRSGLGMGLSLSRSIIENQGGHIWAENNPDKGATFYFDLPGSSVK
jgi:two-component system sensor kinase FixL